MAQMHDVSDPRNAAILINVNGELKPRAEAVVSVFDSGFMLGDGVWEGLRVAGGTPLFLDQHLDRLDRRTTVIFLGDGRSNFADPRLDLMRQAALRDAGGPRPVRRSARGRKPSRTSAPASVWVRIQREHSEDARHSDQSRAGTYMQRCPIRL